MLALLCCFQLKHFLSDYPLQTNFMLGKSKLIDWHWPLVCHCLVHAGFTLIIVACFTGEPMFAIALMLADFVIHFEIDNVKTRMTRGMNPGQSSFWSWLGFDQMLHHLTHYGFIMLMMVGSNPAKIPFT